MDNKSRDTIILREAEMIMKKIEVGRLYGEKIDLSNPNELLYMAYLIGRNDEQLELDSYRRELENFISMTPRRATV